MRILTVLLLTLFTFYARAGSGPAQPRKFIKLSSGVKLHYLEAGSGPTVLLLHGFASWSYSWAETIPDLAAHYHVLVPDLMGYGLSDKPANGNYSWATYVEQLKEFLDLKGVSKVHLAGSSLGGGVAIKFVAAHPEYVDRLALVDSVGAGGNMEKKKKYFEILLSPWLDDLMNNRLTVKMMLRNIFFHDKKKVTDRKIDMYYLPFKTPGAMNASYELIQAISPKFPLSDLQNIRSPTLIVWGLNDRLAPVAESEVFKENIPGSTLEILPNCGHLPQEERPDLFDPLLLKFLAAN